MRKLTKLLLVLLTSSLSARTKHTDYITQQWQVNDMSFPLREVPENQHEEDLGARFLHESGHEMRIPGFYDGENTWIIRFCPPRKGKWNLDEH